MGNLVQVFGLSHFSHFSFSITSENAPSSCNIFYGPFVWQPLLGQTSPCSGLRWFLKMSPSGQPARPSGELRVQNFIICSDYFLGFSDTFYSCAGQRTPQL